MDRSHQGGVQCTWTVTLACLSFELLPFFYSYLNFVRSISPNYTSYGYEILWVDRSHQRGVQCTWTVTLVYLFFELWPFVYFHTRVLSGAYLEIYTCYGYEILWVDRSYQGGVQCIWTVTLACLIFELLPFVFFIIRFFPVHISKTKQAMVMKFCGWIDHIKGECSAHEP